MKRARQVLGLFFQFMKFGLFTFGGGWSIVAQMQKLYVEQAYVDAGPILKRGQPRAHGRMFRINKRTSHITVVVAEKE